MRIFAPAFLLGVCAILWFQQVPSVWVLLAVLGVAVAWCVFVRLAVPLVLGVALGLVWVMMWAHVQEAETLKAPTSVTVQGRVMDFPRFVK